MLSKARSGPTYAKGPFAALGNPSSPTAVRADCWIGELGGGHQTEVTIQRADTTISHNEWQGVIISTRNQ